jgi:hypothetical protein
MAEIGTLVTNIFQDKLEKLEKLYIFEDRTQVLNFIDQHPFLVPVLLEAPAKIGEYFQYKHLRLKLEIDPEVKDWNELFLIIVPNFQRTEITDQELEQTLDKLRQLDNGWWDKVAPRIENKLEIDIGFS